MLRFSYFLMIILTTLSCNRGKNDTVTKVDEKLLNSKSTNEFAKIFHKIPIYGEIYDIKKAYHVYSNLVTGLYSSSDTSDYYFFRLEDGKRSLQIAAHRKLHYISVCPEFDNQYLLDESITFHYDLNFLKDDSGLFEFDIVGTNSDAAKWRKTSFDNRLINKWHLDSIKFSNEIDFFNKSSEWVFNKDNSLYIDSIKFDYKILGQELIIISENNIDTFFRATITSTNMILGIPNNAKNEYLFFSKIIK